MPGIDELSGALLARLADGSVRAVLLAVMAAAALKAARVKRPAAQHAVWTMVAACMLIAPWVRIPAPRWTMPLIEPALVLSGTPAPAPGRVMDGRRVMIPAPLPQPVRWPRWLAGLYLAGAAGMALRLMTGYRTARRLRSAGQEVRDPELLAAWEQACARMSLAWPLPAVRETDAVAVPLVVGTRDPVLLLPPDWGTWDAGTRRAALLHEAAHCRRRDGAAAMLAAVNVCAYWFHPVAWWVAGRLPVLAEHAADDAALSGGAEAREYAAAVLEFAKAASGGGRVLLGSSAMARTGNVSRRIERILDGPRSLGFASRRTWTMVIALAVPLVCATAALQVGSVRRQLSTPVPQPNTVELLGAGYRMTAAEVTEAEARLRMDPHDLKTRAQLIAYYFMNAIPAQRLEHIFWVIENHPDSWVTSSYAARISPKPGLLNSAEDFERARKMWQLQATRHARDTRVLSNAAQFLEMSDAPTATRLLKQARQIDPANGSLTEQLVRLCTRILSGEAEVLVNLTGSGAPMREPAVNPAFRVQLQAELESSNDALLIGSVGETLAAATTYPSFNPPPEMVMVVREVRQIKSEIAQRLLERAVLLEPENLRWNEALERLRNRLPPSEAPGGLSRIRVGSGAQQTMLVSTVSPQYPPLARQARIQGMVRLDVVIGKDGKVVNATVASGHPLLAPAALEAVKLWQYQPTFLNGQPMEVATQVDVPFTLKPGD